MSFFHTLISARELALCLEAGKPDWVVFDCRHDLADVEFGPRAYAGGHIPGAHFLHLDRDLSGPLNGKNGRHPLPDAKVLAERLAGCGVGPQTQVVAYDDAGGMFAARLWWLLRWLGHERVAVLDGGLQAWSRAGQALSTALPESLPAAVALQKSPVIAVEVDVDFVLANLGTRAALIVDARSPDRFRGENETLDPVGGHIPGAVNRFFRDNLARNGTFKPAAELRADFERVIEGFAADEVVHQCGSGVTACHNLLAMEHAGLGGSRLYPGSWSEWCADDARPVPRGQR